MPAPLYSIASARLAPGGVPPVGIDIDTSEIQFSRYPLLLADLGPDSLTQYLLTLTVLFTAIPSGSVTLRVRQDDEATGTILLSFATSTVGTPVSGTALVSKPASTARLFLTGQGTAINNRIALFTFSLQRP